MAIGWRAPDPVCPPAKAYSAAPPRPAPGCPAHSQSPEETNTSCVVPAPLKSARRRAVSNSTKCCRAFSSRRARPRRSGPSWLLVASLTSSTQHPAWSCAGTSHSWCVARAAQRGGGGQGVCLLSALWSNEPPSRARHQAPHPRPAPTATGVVHPCRWLFFVAREEAARAARATCPAWALG
jgi:hypothetical protein